MNDPVTQMPICGDTVRDLTSGSLAKVIGTCGMDYITIEWVDGPNPKTAASRKWDDLEIVERAVW